MHAPYPRLSDRATPTERADLPGSGDDGDRAEQPDTVRAAGALPWRHRKGRLEVALIHRVKYDDWGWPKGKLDLGEDWPGAAVREVGEETGLRVRLGVPLPTARYRLTGPDGTMKKEVRYWAARVTGGDGRLEHEIDAVRWLPVSRAMKALSYSHDKRQLRQLAGAHRQGSLETWPFLVIRHAKAVPRRDWDVEDWLRPLDGRGSSQAEDLVPLIGAYAVGRVVTSSSTRCVQTVAPYAEARGVPLKESRWLSEEGYEENPRRARRYVEDLLRRGQSAALCSHGPLLPDVLDLIRDRLAHSRQLVDSRTPGLLERRQLGKGEVLVAHVRGRGRSARVVAVERHPPIR